MSESLLESDFHEQCPCTCYLEDASDLKFPPQQLDKEEIKRTLWEIILSESRDETALREKWRQRRYSLLYQSCRKDGASYYLVEHLMHLIFPSIKVALLLLKMYREKKLKRFQVSGLDCIAEILWNRNPQHPERSAKWLNVFEIPNFRCAAKRRSFFPKSWLWSEEEAALEIQRHVRGFLVRKREDVQEMRQFWREIRREAAAAATRSI